MDNYEFHWNIVFDAFPQLLAGAFTTIHVSVLSMLVGIVIAVLLALGKMSSSKVFYHIANVWVETARNLPALFLIYMAYFGLGAYGIHLSPYLSVFSALVFIMQDTWQKHLGEGLSQSQVLNTVRQNR